MNFREISEKHDWKTLQQSDVYEHRAAKALNTTWIMRVFIVEFCTETDITPGQRKHNFVYIIPLTIISSL